MCFKEYIMYLCGHRSMAVVRVCPLTTASPELPVCPLQPSTRHMAKVMCTGCERQVHSRWVLIREWENRFMHERGACACLPHFPGHFYVPRVIGEVNGGSCGRANCIDGTGALNPTNIPQLTATSSAGGERHNNLRIPSLFAAEWPLDHRRLHETGQCRCNAQFVDFRPDTRETDLTPEEHEILRLWREHKTHFEADQMRPINWLGLDLAIVQQQQQQQASAPLAVQYPYSLGLEAEMPDYRQRFTDFTWDPAPEQGGPPAPPVAATNPTSGAPVFAVPNTTLLGLHPSQLIGGDGPSLQAGPGPDVNDNHYHYQAGGPVQMPPPPQQQQPPSSDTSRQTNSSPVSHAMPPAVVGANLHHGHRRPGICGFPVGAGPEPHGLSHAGPWEECSLRKGNDAAVHAHQPAPTPVVGGRTTRGRNGENGRSSSGRRALNHQHQQQEQQQNGVGEDGDGNGMEMLKSENAHVE